MFYNKDRLYVALYARGGVPNMPGGEDRYHWALLSGPKAENKLSRCKRYQAKENAQALPIVWEYNEKETKLEEQTATLLVRVKIGKIKNISNLELTLRSVPLRAGQPGWNSVEWVREALEAIRNNGKAMGTSNLDWTTVRDNAMDYVQRKVGDHRFDEQAPGLFDMSMPATFDLLVGKETIP